MLTGDLTAIRVRDVFCQIGFEKVYRNKSTCVMAKRKASINSSPSGYLDQPMKNCCSNYFPKCTVCGKEKKILQIQESTL